MLIKIPRGTGDWAKDNEAGRRFAADTVSYMERERLPGYLPRVCREIVLRGEWGAVEVGFTSMLSMMLLKR